VNLLFKYEFVSAYLENQMATIPTPVQTFGAILWDKSIYFSRYIDEPAQVIDCMNECLNVQPGVCQMFSFVNGICYLGRSDVTNGTMANILSNAIVYSVTCEYLTDLILQYSSLCLLDWISLKSCQI
jgi:hypothetical protein